MAQVTPTRSAGNSAVKSTVEVEHLPAKMIELLDLFVGRVKDNGTYAKIHIEIGGGGDVKRFECLESYLVSAL